MIPSLCTIGGKVAAQGFFWYSFTVVSDRGSATLFLPLSAEVGAPPWSERPPSVRQSGSLVREYAFFLSLLEVDFSNS